MSSEQGVLFILVGPGGVGKNALMERILHQVEDLHQLPTATTRPPRDYEVDGVHHFFVSLDQFRSMIHHNELLEYQEVYPGKFYGVPRGAVAKAVYNGHARIADIEFKGATIIRDAFPDHTVAVFIAPPSVEILRERLYYRQDSQQDIDNRLARMSADMLYAPLCDHVIVNDDFEQAVAELIRLIRCVRRGEAVTTSHTVEFLTAVTVMNHDAVLRSTAGTEPTLSAPVRFGEHPLEVAARLLADHLPGQINQSRMVYHGVGGAMPAVMELTEDRYRVCYHYRYDVPERVEIDGMVWS